MEKIFTPSHNSQTKFNRVYFRLVTGTPSGTTDDGYPVAAAHPTTAVPPGPMRRGPATSGLHHALDHLRRATAGCPGTQVHGRSAAHAPGVRQPRQHRR